MKRKYMALFTLLAFSNKALSHGRGGEHEHDIVYHAKRMGADQRACSFYY